jgi:hypothetical protein
MTGVSQNSRDPHEREHSLSYFSNMDEHPQPSSVFHLLQFKDVPPAQLSQSG